MHGRRLHVKHTTLLKHQLLKIFSDASFGNSQRLLALRRATRLPSLSVYDILQTIHPEFSAPPVRISCISGFVSAFFDIESTGDLTLTTLWNSPQSMSMCPDSVDSYIAGPKEKRVSSGSYRCFIPLQIANDPTVSFLSFSAGSFSVDAIDTVVDTHILAGSLSDANLCASIERTFDSSQNIYEISIAWSLKTVNPSRARQSAVQALREQLVKHFNVDLNVGEKTKQREMLQSTASSKSKPAVFRKVSFGNQDSAKRVRECFDDCPINLFPNLASELSKAAIVACGYCKESTACLDTLYSPRFLASSLSSAAVMLFERGSALFPSGSAVSFAEKLLFRHNIFFPPKVTIQKAIVRLLTANIDESNSGIILKVFRRCRHVSVLTLLIGTCQRLFGTPSKVDLGKRLLLEISELAFKAEKETIAAFSKLCEVSFLDIRSFLANHLRWNTPVRSELTQEWEEKKAAHIDISHLPWCNHYHEYFLLFVMFRLF
jgi:hypothetical protein